MSAQGSKMGPPGGCCSPPKDLLERMMNDPRVQGCMKEFAGAMCEAFARHFAGGEAKGEGDSAPGGCGGGGESEKPTT